MEATIVIHRPKSWFGILRKLKLLIDGELAAAIRNGERVELSLSPGDHTLQLKMDWCVSPELEVDLEPSTKRFFECLMPNRAFRATFVEPGFAFHLIETDGGG